MSLVTREVFAVQGASALPRGTRVKVTDWTQDPPVVAAAAAADADYVGVLNRDMNAEDGYWSSVIPRNTVGTVIGVAAGVCTQGGVVKLDAGGKVSDAGAGADAYVAMTAAANDGDEIELLPAPA